MRWTVTASMLLLIGLGTVPARAERFRYQLKAGQVHSFRANMAGASMLGQPGGSMMKMQFRTGIQQTQRVRSITSGVVTLDVTDTTLSGKMTAAGRTESMAQPPSKSVVKITERGKFISRTYVGGDAETAPGGDLEGTDVTFGLNFPDRDLKPGDTWRDTFKIGAGPERREVQAEWKYVGREKFRGRDCARISTRLTMSMSDAPAVEGASSLSRGKLTATMTTYFDPKAGLEVYSSGAVLMHTRMDLSALSPDAGEIANATKINLIQWLASSK